MLDSALDAEYGWLVVTHLGSATLALPTLALTAIGLWQSRQYRATRLWITALGLAISITLVSKILFLGWGIGVATLDFTGISGHTLLATSCLPVLFSALLLPNLFRFRAAGTALGLLIGAGVALSRVVLGAHSISEVVCAWLIGSTVSLITVRSMENKKNRPWIVYFAPCLLFLAFSTKHANILPTHGWEINIALFVSGHEKPYTRPQLHVQQNEHASRL